MVAFFCVPSYCRRMNKNVRLDNDLRFEWYVAALRQYRGREGHCRVPALHTEVLEGMEIKLGSFVSYTRQRRKKILGAQDAADTPAQVEKARQSARKFSGRARELESISGWEWGPLSPGPVSKTNRNRAIKGEYADGASVKSLADKHDLSRQRVHQIVGPRAYAG